MSDFTDKAEAERYEVNVQGQAHAHYHYTNVSYDVLRKTGVGKDGRPTKTGVVKKVKRKAQQ